MTGLMFIEYVEEASLFKGALVKPEPVDLDPNMFTLLSTQNRSRFTDDGRPEDVVRWVTYMGPAPTSLVKLQCAYTGRTLINTLTARFKSTRIYYVICSADLGWRINKAQIIEWIKTFSVTQDVFDIFVQNHHEYLKQCLKSHYRGLLKELRWIASTMNVTHPAELVHPCNENCFSIPHLSEQFLSIEQNHWNLDNASYGAYIRAVWALIKSKTSWDCLHPLTFEEYALSSYIYERLDYQARFIYFFLKEGERENAWTPIQYLPHLIRDCRREIRNVGAKGILKVSD